MGVDTYRNYLAKVEASVGSTMFQNLYVRTGGKSKDVARGGELSCAIHVSSVLTLVGLIDRPHATVQSTLKAIRSAGWVEADSPSEGAIVYWPEGRDGHEHVGFWLSNDRVISNSTKKLVPVVHRMTMADGRRPLGYFTHPILKG